MNSVRSGAFIKLKTSCVAVTIVAILFHCSLSPALRAEEAAVGEQLTKPELRLTLEECLRRALEKNLSLSAQTLDIGIAEQGVVAAQAPFDSQLGLDLLHEETRGQEETTASDRRRAEVSWSKKIRTGQVFRVTHTASRLNRELDVPLSPFYDLDWTLSAVQPLAKGAGRTANMAPVWIAENQQERTFLAIEETVMNLLLTVEAAYLDLIYAIRFLDVQQSGLTLAKELLSKNEELVRLGKLPGKSIEVLEAKASIATREEGVIISLNEIAKAEDAVRRLMNVPVAPEEGRARLFPADEPLVDLKVPKVEESLAFALAHRPQYRALRLEQDNVRLELAAAKNNRLPEIGLRADVGFAGSNDDYVSSFDELAEGRDYVWQAGLSVIVPWGNRAARSRYAQAKLNYEKTRTLLNDFVEKLKLDVINAHRDIDRDVKRMASTRASVDQSELQLQTENDRYAQGMSNSFRILEFQDDLIEAKIRHLAATIDFNRSYFNLLRVEGRSVRNDRFDLTDLVQGILRRWRPPRTRTSWTSGPGG